MNFRRNVYVSLTNPIFEFSSPKVCLDCFEQKLVLVIYLCTYICFVSNLFVYNLPCQNHL